MSWSIKPPNLSIGMLTILGMITLTIVAFIGCTNGESVSKDSQKTPALASDNSHGGWWCVEHGVPE